MSQETSRRGFLKATLVTAGAAVGLLANVKFDAVDGLKIGKASVKLGVSEASATCGMGMGCSGGGGQCGMGMGCGGGGGKCGFGMGCSGGGGKCGFGMGCGGQ